MDVPLLVGFDRSLQHDLCFSTLRISLFIQNCCQLTIKTRPCQTELQQQESLLYKERKERERILISYRKQVEEHKARAERANRRVQYSARHGRRPSLAGL